MMYTTHLDNSFKFFILELLLLLYFMSMCALPACMSVYLVPAEVQMRVLVPQELEPQMVVSCHGDSNPGCLQSNECSYPWAVSPGLLTPLHFIRNWWALKLVEGFSLFFCFLNSIVWNSYSCLRTHGSFPRYYKNKIVLHSSSMD